MSLGNMDVGDITGALEGADDIMGELEGALDSSELGSLGAASPDPVSVMKLVRDPVRLGRAHQRSAAAELAAVGRARAVRARMGIETDPAVIAILRQAFTLHKRTATQHRLTTRTLHLLAHMRASDMAAGAARPNYAFGLSFSASGGGTGLNPTATDTAVIGPPITDRPWRVLAWQTSILQAQHFCVLNFTPTVDNTVTYGNNGVTYKTTPATTNQYPLWAWCIENYLTPSSPKYNLGFWESPRYIFGPSALVVMQLGSIAADAQSILMLGLGQCQPCGDPAMPLEGPTAFVDGQSVKYAHNPGMGWF